MKTILPKWPSQPWPLLRSLPPLTLAERVELLEWQLRGDEPNGRDLIWLENRAGRLIDQAPQGPTPAPLCERRRVDTTTETV